MQKCTHNKYKNRDTWLCSYNMFFHPYLYKLVKNKCKKKKEMKKHENDHQRYTSMWHWIEVEEEEEEQKKKKNYTQIEPAH